METGLYTQDTVNTRLVIHINTENLLSDSVFRKMDEIPGYLKHANSGRAGKEYGILPQKVVIDDTLSVCSRNSIADITFYDSLNFIKDLKFIPADRIAYPDNVEIADSGKQIVQIVLVKNLKNGDPLPEKPFHNDFITVVIFLAAFFLLSVRSALRKTLQEITRFFLFRGINESSSRDLSSLFNWQSTVINFISFLVLSLFAFSASTYYGMRPAGISPFFVYADFIWNYCLWNNITPFYMCGCRQAQR
jgi:hypothetical protein